MPNFIKSLSVKSSASDGRGNAARTANSPLNGTLRNKTPLLDRLSDEIEYFYEVLHELYSRFIRFSVNIIRSR